MNTNLGNESVWRDLRYHELKAGQVYVREGKMATLEVISSQRSEGTCALLVILTPYGAPADVDPEALARARDAVQFALESPHPRVRAAGELAAQTLACPPAGDLTRLEVDVWWEKSGEWDSRARAPLAADGRTRISGVPVDANCFIELLEVSPGKPTPMQVSPDIESIGEPPVPEVVLLPPLPEQQIPAARFAAPGHGQLRTLKIYATEKGLTARLEQGPRVGERVERLWITFHTMNAELNRATVQYQIGPLRGAVQLKPAGEGWQGIAELKLPTDKASRLSRFVPQFTVQPLKQQP